MPRGWKIECDVHLPEWMPYESDLWIWHHYTLQLLCNRRVPEHFTDREVSNALRKMRERTPLLYEPNK
jgi:hypothetical protein